MAPRASKKRSPSPDPEGMFHGMVVFLVERSVQPRRLQIWKQKLIQMGATIVDGISRRVTHVFAVNPGVLSEQVNNEYLQRYQGHILRYEWLESCLKSGEKLPEDPYLLSLQDVQNSTNKALEPSNDDRPDSKRIKLSCDDLKTELETNQESQKEAKKNVSVQLGNQGAELHVQKSSIEPGPQHDINIQHDTEVAKRVADASASDASQQSSPYNPPDLNRNITEIFRKLIDIYRALGDERRSFSYYKAISAIEKLPFKIENVDQVKHVPSIGKGLQDHIHEIITTGKLSKLDHFENDEKVRAVSLFGEVWGIGPATAVKLYEKGHRTLEDLRHDDSLTNVQKIGLQYFDDIKQRIPRNEVRDMEMLLQKVGQKMLPGVIIICGGSYRRGKASCGDLDIVITHPDGKSHKGFLTKYVQYLKEINFLREDLIFSIHSIEETDSGIDTYFGLCTYPGQELRHRIDFKVYPKDRYAFGLIAWTGNDVLNRRLRLLAESKGYRLDDTGLYLAAWSSDKKRGTKSGNRVTCYTEKEVFDLLGFPWLEPHERNL